MLKASARWGGGELGKEQIPVPVCKVKYQPFRRLPSGRHEVDADAAGIGRNPISDGNGKNTINRRFVNEDGDREARGPQRLEKMFACRLHHEKRRALIERFGPREGWEPFDQWHDSRGASAAATTGTSPTVGMNSRSPSRSQHPDDPDPKRDFEAGEPAHSAPTTCPYTFSGGSASRSEAFASGPNNLSSVVHEPGADNNAASAGMTHRRKRRRK